MKKIFYLILFLFLTACGVSSNTDPFQVQTSRDPFVLNGIEGHHEQFPSIVMLTINGYDEYCSGTLIKPDLVMTAAHCVEHLPNSLEAVYGVDSIPDPLQCRSCFMKVKNSTYHPEFTHFYFPSNDIGLILLEHPVYNPIVGTFLSERNNNFVYVGQTLTLAGYGTSNEGLGQLYYGDVPVTELRGDYEMVVGLDSPTAVNACYGDSGGPAYLYEAGEEYVVGVTSRVPEGKPIECGHGTVYTRPEAYSDWIEQAYQDMKTATPNDPDPVDPNNCCRKPEPAPPILEPSGGCSVNQNTPSFDFMILFLSVLFLRKRQ